MANDDREPSSPWTKIKSVQVRVRRQIKRDDPGVPREQDMFVVILEDDTSFNYAVDMSGVADRFHDVTAISLLRDAYMRGKQVKIGYQSRTAGNKQRIITVVRVGQP